MRRSTDRRKKKPQRNKLVKNLISGVIIIGALALISLYFVIPSKWDKDTQFSYVYPQKNSVVVRLMEPDTKTITDIVIPNSKEVQVANQMGTWRIESVWELGIDEGIDGLLLSRTLNKSLLIPVEGWSEKQINSLRDVLIAFKTNLSFKDKLNIYLFWVANKGDKEEHEYSSVKLPDSLKRLFNYSMISSEHARIEIVNLSGDKTIEEWLVSLIEVMGAKVFSITGDSEINFNKCLVASNKNLATTKIISSVLGCDLVYKSELPRQTIKIYIDNQFVRAY